LVVGDRPCSICDLVLKTLGVLLSDRPAKYRLLQHPGVCGAIFEVICSKIKLASYFEHLFYEYGSNQCS
jgi:hypothetical protein